ncbi:hypothetical protein [Xenorhabdus sp. IM139775]|uniref:hypothetical protein n=1 Tax=Xenorhabdus sp. IM139775 TaxID=3025876 RepID=UPI002358188C|nr:hypothetical protein [Xenorhabdus sp. IM139775]MDC9594201.1 hypothetical protein [Xenorhabdus sp. IM139775]
MLTPRNPHEIKVNPPQNGLHRTRLHVLDQKIISVLKFYKASCQTAPVLAVREKSQNEMGEKIFRKLQFLDLERIQEKYQRIDIKGEILFYVRSRITKKG